MLRRRIHLIAVFAALMRLSARSVNAEADLLSELQPKSEKEGRAVDRVAGNVVNVYPFVQARYFVFGGIQ